MKGTVDMIELNYQLNKNDILDYYQVVLSRASETKTSRLLVLVWGPILLFTIGIYKLAHPAELNLYTSPFSSGLVSARKPSRIEIVNAYLYLIFL